MAKLELHTELYANEALELTREVFAEHAEVEIRRGESRIEVELRPRSADVDERELRGEFANYALALTIEARRAG